MNKVVSYSLGNLPARPPVGDPEDNTFKVLLHLPVTDETVDAEGVEFVFPKKYTIDQAKADVFKKTPTLAELKAQEWNFGWNQDEILEVEFLKFCNSSPRMHEILARGERPELFMFPTSFRPSLRKKFIQNEAEPKRVLSEDPGVLELAKREEPPITPKKRRTKSLPHSSKILKKERRPKVLPTQKGSMKLRDMLKEQERKKKKKGKGKRLAVTQELQPAAPSQVTNREEISFEPPFLTTDLLRLIFGFIVDPKQMAAISLTCKSWNSLVSHDMKVCREKLKIKKMLSRQHGLVAQAARDEDKSFYSRFPVLSVPDQEKIKASRRLSNTSYTQIPPRVPPRDHRPVLDDTLERPGTVRVAPKKELSWTASEDGWIVPLAKEKESPSTDAVVSLEKFQKLKAKNKRLKEENEKLKDKLRQRRVKERKEERQLMEVLTYFANTLCQMESLKKLTVLEQGNDNLPPATGPSDRFEGSIEGWELLKELVHEEGLAAPTDSRIRKQLEPKSTLPKKEKMKDGKASVRKRGRTLTSWKRKDVKDENQIYEVEKKIVKGYTWEGGNIRDLIKSMDSAEALLHEPGSGKVFEGLSPRKGTSEAAESVNRPTRVESEDVASKKEKEREKGGISESEGDTEAFSVESTTSSPARGTTAPQPLRSNSFFIGPENIRKISAECLERGKNELLKLTTEAQRQKYWILKKDFMDGESKFVMHILNTIMNVFYRPLQQSLLTEKNPIISQVDFDVIFGDFAEFHEQHTEFYYECVHIWQKGEFLGKVIYDYGLHMSAFQFRFIENYNLAVEQIKKLKIKNKRFKQFMEDVEFTEQSQFLDLTSLLAKPVGRFAYYRLMLERYLAYVDENEHIFAPGMFLLGKLKEVLTRLSANSEEEDSQRFQMLELQIQKKSGRFVDFLKPGRQLLHKGKIGIRDAETGKITRPYVLVCNDLIVIGKKLSRSKDYFHATHVYSLLGATLVNPVGEENNNSLILLTTETPLILVAKSAEQRGLWKDALKKALNNLCMPLRILEHGSRTEYSITRPAAGIIVTSAEDGSSSGDSEDM